MTPSAVWLDCLNAHDLERVVLEYTRHAPNDVSVPVAFDVSRLLHG